MGWSVVIMNNKEMSKIFSYIHADSPLLKSTFFYQPVNPVNHAPLIYIVGECLSVLKIRAV